MLTDVQVIKLAELIYINIEGAPVPWAKLGQEAKDEQVKKIKAILDNVSRLGYELTPAGALEKANTVVNADVFKLYCKDFLREVDPKNLISKLFPMDELTARLQRDFIIRDRKI